MAGLNYVAYKGIVSIGLGAFLLLMAVAWGLKQSVKRSEAQRVSILSTSTPFDGRRAYGDLGAILEFGPRVSNSPASAKTRAFIRDRMAEAGVSFREEPFTARTPRGEVPMTNLVAEIKGNTPGTILLTNHYDTKYMPDITFLGANDGGSTTAWMIEMARAIGPKRNGRTLWLCFFDGEEALEDWSATDSLYGSRAFVDKLRAEGKLDDVRAVINVDMIGDCYLGIFKDPGAPVWLTDAVWSVADSAGHAKAFLDISEPIQDDHIPFRNAGIPAINLIDFRFGGSRLDHARNWHTPNDSIDRVCWESLQAVGDVLYQSLHRIDSSLDRVAAN